MLKKSQFFNNSLFSARKHRKTGDIDPGTRKKVRCGVLITHVALLLLPLTWYLIASLFTEPRLKTIKVTLVSPSSVTAIAPAPTKALNQPSPRKPHKPKRPKPLPEPRKSAPRKPSWKPKKASQIKVSRKVIDNSPSPRYTPPTPVRTVTAAEIEKRLRAASARSVRTTATPSANNGGTVSRDYQQKLYSAIYALWRQPSKAELNGLCPTANISFTLNASGRVSNPRISRKSGIPVMDASVRRLILDLRTLPRPPKGRMSLTVSLEIVNP